MMVKIVKQNFKLLPEDALITAKQINEISKFPLSSFIDLAFQIKEINKHSIFCVDILNPNNLLVNFKEKKLQLIDLFNRNRIPLLELFTGDINSMLNLILCSLYHSEIVSLLNDHQRRDLKSNVHKIVIKCEIAANLVELPLSKLTPEEVYDRVEDFCRFMKESKPKRIFSCLS